MEDDKVLVLCQERKRFVREALDRRCALASTHYDYIASLKDTGSLLKKCFEGDKGAANEDDFADSDLSTETLEQVSKNRSTSTEQSTAYHASKSVASENIASAYSLKHKSRVIDVITNENDEIPAMNLVNVVSSSAPTRHMDSKEPYPDVSNVVRDLSLCMKEIEILFFRAGDSGEQVPMILEEDKIQFRPLLSEEIG
jgi:hypothetical protein